MKKIALIAVTIISAALLFAGCSATKSAMYGGSLRAKFVGSWTLNTVTYEGLVQGSVQTVFDQGKPEDFMGSTWKLTNSGNGSYKLANGTSQNIFWSIATVGADQVFQFKKLYQGDKPQHVADGYQLTIAGNDGNAMTLKTPVSLGKGFGYVVYTFSKNP